MAQPVVVHVGRLQTVNIPTQRPGAVGILALQGGEDVNTVFSDMFVRQFLELVISKDRSNSVPDAILVER
ncbi:hypothetical protein C5C07_19445 [Haloferax sp. Atlit-4N]|nr:hypothetical protein C5B86_18830 [Haloferax sp. Atlit-19N]RDZ50196.1 hypothetical protein C5C07_19445 [Haloferax sp. Atlit-4N]